MSVGDVTRERPAGEGDVVSLVSVVGLASCNTPPGLLALEDPVDTRHNLGNSVILVCVAAP